MRKNIAGVYIIGAMIWGLLIWFIVFLLSVPLSFFLLGIPLAGIALSTWVFMYGFGRGQWFFWQDPKYCGESW